MADLAIPDDQFFTLAHRSNQVSDARMTLHADRNLFVVWKLMQCIGKVFRRSALVFDTAIF
ncbi:hypothetical protein [Xanthomonas hortorum]|uniref:hypothetical protein n=1 Tax=Xanthomonas hortorum TaxID=56454 RepID=UPI002936CDBD|nr:hypothetical protein [Xanthomonas hortorum]MDV2451945.1 hypothetical protein [Xanthomonas hortorum NBC5720]